MKNERSNSLPNILMDLAIMALAVLINPFVKLKDRLKGEHE